VKLRIYILALLLLGTKMAVAHGNEQHIMGTITKVSDTSIAVKTQDGRSVDVVMSPETKFTRKGQPISLKDVKVGDRVVIHAKKENDKLVATTVAVGMNQAERTQEVNGITKDR